MGFRLLAYSSARASSQRILNFLGTVHDVEGLVPTSSMRHPAGKLVLTHWLHLALLLSWLSGIPVHVGLQGNLELWLDNPLRFAGIAHSLWEPHFGIAAEQPWRDHFHPLASGLAAACFYCWSRSVGFVSASQFLTFGSALEVRALCLCLSAGLGCWMGSCWLTPCLVSSQLSQPCRALALGSLLWSGHLGWAAHAGSQLTQRIVACFECHLWLVIGWLRWAAHEVVYSALV